MYKNKRVLALIAARGGSKGLPGKNVREIAGRPLIAWSVLQGLKSKSVDRLVVTTDDEAIAAAAREAGADVPFMRPSEIAQDTSSIADAILHAVDTLAAAGDEYDIVVLLECTSPARYPGDVDRVISTLVDDPKRAGSVVGVVRLTHEHPAWTFRVEDGTLINYNSKGLPPSLTQRQSLDAAYLPYSLYASWISTFREHRLFYQPNTAPLYLRREQMVEIDEDVDFVLAEAIMKKFIVPVW